VKTQYLGDYCSYSDVIIQLKILLGARWHMWPWPSQKGSKCLDLLYSFPVPVCRRLDLERSYLVWWGCERAVAVFCFVADLDLLLRLWCTVIWQI